MIATQSFSFFPVSIAVGWGEVMSVQQIVGHNLTFGIPVFQRDANALVMVVVVVVVLMIGGGGN